MSLTGRLQNDYKATHFFMDAYMTYTKLFHTILDSSVWMEDAPTRIVWVTMMAMADKGGMVMASLPGLAHRARVSVEECKGALEKFMRPDPHSRTVEFEGRRIEQVDGGWRLLNHGKYRALMSAEDRRAYNRQKQAEYRARKNGGSTAMERLIEKASTPEEKARVEEIVAGMAPGALGSYGPEAQEVVRAKVDAGGQDSVSDDMPDPDTV